MPGIKVTMVIEPKVFNDIRAGAIKLQSLRGISSSDIKATKSAMEVADTGEQLKNTIGGALSIMLVDELIKYPAVNQPVQINLSIEAIR